MPEERLIIITLLVSALGLVALGWGVPFAPDDNDYGEDWNASFKTIEVEIDGELFEAIVPKKRQTSDEGSAPAKADAGANFF